MSTYKMELSKFNNLRKSLFKEKNFCDDYGGATYLKRSENYAQNTHNGIYHQTHSGSQQFCQKMFSAHC